MSVVNRMIGKPRDAFASEPMHPAWIKRLCKLHEKDGKTFEECAVALGSSRANCHKQYHRWAKWYKRNQ